MNVGHGRQEIYDAINAQMQKLAIYHIFQIANEPAIKLAAKVAEHMPGDLNHVFLTLGGGESVETAVKMARQYWRNKGQGTKYMVMFRDRSYHGTTMTSVSAQGLTVNRAKFEPLLPGFIKLGAPYCYQCAWNKTYGEDCKMECATQVEQEIAFYGPENVGTMLGETMIGTGGVIPRRPSTGRWSTRSARPTTCLSSTTRSSPASAAPAPGSASSSSARTPTHHARQGPLVRLPAARRRRRQGPRLRRVPRRPR